MSENRMEVIWGTKLLDEGFTSIPNLLIRNYRKLKIEHGEFGFICQLLSHQHDARDPYPSRELLAAYLCCSSRQIDKWVKSLRTKGLLRTGRRRNVHNKQWDNTVYSFKPLLDSLLRLVGEKELPVPADEFEVIWDDEEKGGNDPCEPEVRMDLNPQVRMDLNPQVRTKKKSKNNNIKKDCLIEATAKNAAASTSHDSNIDDAEELKHEVYETLKTEIPKNCFYKGLPLSDHDINQIYLMLDNQFTNRLSPEVIKIAAGIYFDRACYFNPAAPNGISMKLDVTSPTGFFQNCYTDALKQYKVTKRNKQKVESH
ncbi:helix-turn-helix domain-containing protein [Paenibacillus alvei]|uniref:Helix-turn-helix domain-containing protein n=1 Tax=Paenibacillus alvei TaxID=44250 RepID=A0AAP7A1R4_PAEAL|nr:helix-turn-helix domain-containing protein [Paenibacillus alvei]NOJ74073.1 helix-turn-helix domain-containing protein [Paenibacillus alvei]